MSPHNSVPTGEIKKESHKIDRIFEPSKFEIDWSERAVSDEHIWSRKTSKIKNSVWFVCNFCGVSSKFYDGKLKCYKTFLTTDYKDIDLQSEMILGYRNDRLMAKYYLDPKIIFKNDAKGWSDHENGNNDNDNSNAKFSTISSRFSLRIDLIKHSQTNIPIIAFVNTRSGAKQGTRLYNLLCRCLNPRQVFKLPNYNPRNILRFFEKLPRFIVLCCSGDGSIGWVSSSMLKENLDGRISLSCLPIGSGNDLSRTLKCGAKLSRIDERTFEKYSNTIENVENRRKFDLWQASFQNRANVAKLKNNIFNNYFSVGADAFVAWRFDKWRRKPNILARKQSKNRTMLEYAYKSANYALRRNYSDLCDRVELISS